MKSGTSETSGTVDFGYEQVPVAEKAARVRGVFDSVAAKYDLMNDLMSGGLHRLWKRFALSQTGLRPGMRALDVAAGTCDLGAGLARQVGREGLVVVSDINREMLARGRDQAFIAEYLHISVDTVKTHRRSIYRKLDIHSHQELLTLLEDARATLGDDASPRIADAAPTLLA